jgi:hypothetical protein
MVFKCAIELWDERAVIIGQNLISPIFFGKCILILEYFYTEVVSFVETLLIFDRQCSDFGALIAFLLIHILSITSKSLLPAICSTLPG